MIKTRLNRKKLKVLQIAVAMITVILIMTSCKVVEPYKRAEVASDALYRDLATDDSTNMATLSWKEVYRDTVLQRLIQEGIDNNLDMQIAVARINKAKANFKQSRLALFPSLSLDETTIATATAESTSEWSSVTWQGGQSYELSLGSAWEIDLWGKLRSTKRAYLNSLLNSEAYKRAVQTQLIADIASYYYTLLAYDSKLSITEHTVEIRKQDVETMKLMKESNTVTGAAVVQSQASRYSAEVSIPTLKQNIWETENSLSILLGRNPGTIERSTLDEQQIDVDPKIGLPAQLLANRPDVQQAEFELRYYTEMINVARSYFYPTISIYAGTSGGLTNTDITELFDATSLFANLIGNISQPLFNQGANQQRLRVAKANQMEYLANFKQTLLSAGKEVSDALYNYQNITKRMELRSMQIQYLEKSVEYTNELLRYTSSTNYTDVLTSQESLLNAQLSGITDKLDQLNAIVTLYRCLGGGVQ